MPRARGRPDLFVVARMLDRLAEGPARTAAQLQAAVGLNWDLFRKYCELLEQRGCLQWSDGTSGRVATLTAEGFRARERIDSALREWLGNSEL